MFCGERWEFVRKIVSLFLKELEDIVCDVLFGRYSFMFSLYGF